MKRTWLALSLSLACLSLTACPKSGGADDASMGTDGGIDMTQGSSACSPDPLPAVDFGTPPTGVVPKAGDIGTPCTMDAQCKQGTTPTCWTAKIFNRDNLDDVYKTAGGYCSSPCTKDADCGTDNLCIDFGSLGKACIAGCADAVTCRHPGYSCTVMSIQEGNLLTGCFPNGLLSCDPTQPECTDLRYGQPGACYRQAVEDDHGGICYPTCVLGDVCEPDIFDAPTQCLYLDFTDVGDAFRGTMCFPAASAPKGLGDSCMFTDDCEDGLQCDNGPTGSKKCEKLCNLKNKSPRCSASQVCTKAFPTCEAGLCRAK